MLARPPPGCVFAKLAPNPGSMAIAKRPTHRPIGPSAISPNPRCAWSTPTNQHVQRYHFVRAKLEAGSMDGAIVKVHSNGTGTPGARVPPRTSSLEPAPRSASARYHMTNNDNRPLFDMRCIAIASACAVLAVLATHHPVADAQSVDGAVSPAASQDAAGAANRRLKLDPAATATALQHRPASARCRGEPEIGGGVERESATSNRISSLHAEPISGRPVTEESTGSHSMTAPSPAPCW